MVTLAPPPPEGAATNSSAVPPELTATNCPGVPNEDAVSLSPTKVVDPVVPV